MVTMPSEDDAPPFNFRAEMNPEMKLQKWGLIRPHLFFVCSKQRSDTISE
jgi:hypothetical protein